MGENDSETAIAVVICDDADVDEEGGENLPTAQEVEPSCVVADALHVDQINSCYVAKRNSERFVVAEWCSCMIYACFNSLGFLFVIFPSTAICMIKNYYVTSLDVYVIYLITSNIARVIYMTSPTPASEAAFLFDAFLFCVNVYISVSVLWAIAQFRLIFHHMSPRDREVLTNGWRPNQIQVVGSVAT